MSRAGRRDGWQSFFWTLFKRSRNAVSLVDENRVNVEVNGAFLRLLRCKRADLVGHPAADVLAGGPRLSLSEWRARAFRGEWMGELDLVCSDGTLVAVEYGAV